MYEWNCAYAGTSGIGQSKLELDLLNSVTGLGRSLRGSSHLSTVELPRALVGTRHPHDDYATADVVAGMARSHQNVSFSYRVITTLPYTSRDSMSRKPSLTSANGKTL